MNAEGLFSTNKKIIKRRAHPELNWRPADLQSAALPLSYTPDLSDVNFYAKHLYFQATVGR